MLLFALLIPGLVQAQSVKVIDAFSQQPLDRVVVINETKDRYTTTNNEGVFDLGVFVPDDLLTFHFTGLREYYFNPKRN